MDDKTSEKQDAKSDSSDDNKKSGFLLKSIPKIGINAGAGMGAGATAGVGAGATIGTGTIMGTGAGFFGTGGVAGAFGGLLSGGVLATKAGILALAIAGSTVAGGIGYMGYKLFVSPNASGKSSAGDKDKFSSLFASRPKDASSDRSSGSSAPNQGGNSSSLEFLAKANQGPLAEGENKPEESAAPEAESKTSDAAADQAPVNPAAALNNANAPSPGQAASFHSSGLKSDKKFGALSGNLAGGSSGASFSTAMKGAPAASNPLLAKGGKVDPTSAMRGQGRSLLAGRRDQFKRESNSRRQLGNLNRMQKGGVGNAGSLTFDGGPGGTTIGAAEGGEIGGAPSGQSGVPDRSINPTPFSQKELNEVADPPSRDVTPWKDEIKKGKIWMLAAMAGFFLAIMLLQHYYEQWVEEYNAGWFAAYARGFIAAANKCLATFKETVAALNASCPTCISPVTAAVGTAIGNINTAGAKLTSEAAAAKAKAAAAQAKGATINVLTNATVGGATVAGSDTAAVTAANEAMRAQAQATAVTAVDSAIGTINGVLAAAYTCCYTTSCTPLTPPNPLCVPCTAAGKALSAAVGVANPCLQLSPEVTEAQALTAANLAAESQAAIWKWLSRAAIVGALAASAKVIDIGTKMQKGEYNQENAGKIFVIGGAFMAAVSGWFLISELTTADVPTGTDEVAAAKSGTLKADSMTKLAPFASMPTLMSTIGIAALLGVSGMALMAKPEKYQCKTDAECKKIEDTGYLLPSERAPGERSMEALLFASSGIRSWKPQRG